MAGRIGYGIIQATGVKDFNNAWSTSRLSIHTYTGGNIGAQNAPDGNPSPYGLLVSIKGVFDVGVYAFQLFSSAASGTLYYRFGTSSWKKIV